MNGRISFVYYLLILLLLVYNHLDFNSRLVKAFDTASILFASRGSVYRCPTLLPRRQRVNTIAVFHMSSPTKRRDMDVMKLMMSSHEVQTGPGGSLAEFYVKFNGPAGEGGCTCARAQFLTV